MKVMTFEDFNKVAKEKGPNYAYKLSNLLNKVREIVDEDKIKIFYPKYILNDNYTKLEIVMITEQNVIVLAKANWEEENIQIFIYKSFDIETLLFKTDIGASPNAELLIKFKDGNKIFIQGLEDSNESRKADYVDAIKEIVKCLIL